MKSGTVASLSGRRSFLSDHKVARSAASSGKVPGFAAAITQFSAGAAYVACVAMGAPGLAVLLASPLPRFRLA